MKSSAAGGQRGAALVIMLAVLIVVSIGILAMTNGIGNMQRSAVNFGRADQAYNAASTGLNAARAYLKSLAFETVIENVTFGDELVSADEDETVLGRYNVTIKLTNSDEDYEDVVIGDVDGIPIMGRFWDNRYTYNVRSEGSSSAGQGKRILEQVMVLRRVITPSRERRQWRDTSYIVLANGNLKLGGNANFGNVHTNANFLGDGSAAVTEASAVGTAAHKGSFSYVTLTPHAQPIAIPEPDWAALAAGGPNGTTYVLKPGEDLKQLDPSIYDGTKYNNIYVDGDLDLTGKLDINVNIFATGRVSIYGNVKVYGLVYAQNKNGYEEAISLTGNAYVKGGLFADGPITATGSFEGSLDGIRQEIEQIMTQEVTVTEQVQSVEETPIIDVPDKD